MGSEDSIKKLNRKLAKKTRKEDSGKGISHIDQIEGKKKNDKKKSKSSGEIRVEAEMVETSHVKDKTLETSLVKRKSRKLRDKRGNKSTIARKDTVDHVNEVEDTIPERVFDVSERSKEKLPNPTEKKRKNVEVEDTIPKRVFDVSEPSKEKLPKPTKKKRKNVESINHVEINDASEQCNGNRMTDSKTEEQVSNSEGINKGDTKRNSKKGKLKKLEKIKKEKHLAANQLSTDNLLEMREEDEVYQMSSGDEDYSKGMTKWISQYHQSRPGLKVLQERIDDFITAHDAKEEQAKAERLAQAAEGGWTVVVHHKGRKKTTDADTGIAVGAVAQAAVLDKMAKKKKKEVGLAFYQFHKREAHRNEIMMLQSKFEQDKKRIQQMRAARKFRPY